jgi:uncharacterized protein YbbK (DUF523 family)
MVPDTSLSASDAGALLALVHKLATQVVGLAAERDHWRDRAIMAEVEVALDGLGMPRPAARITLRAA